MSDHDHSHGEEHSHHDHDHHHPHGDHDHPTGFWATLREAVPFLHGHSHGDLPLDNALESSERGIWALKVSLGVLVITALIQITIVLISGSVGLLADTIHNFSDALTAIPLGIAFLLSRRLATRRYSYGYGRAEDIAGVLIVVMILGSALVAAYESYQKIIHPQPLTNLGWVMIAALIGFAGNETVALFRIRVGREIGSAALIADGQHARVDGFTSLAVFFGALGSLISPIADPIVGLLISVAILFIVKDTVVAMWYRLMDAIDPQIMNDIEHAAAKVPGAVSIGNVRARWIGHTLQAELNVAVDEDLPTRESHRIAEEVRHALFHAQPKLVDITVHIEPCGHSGSDPHETTAHHNRQTEPISTRP
jgi:cation diffusion facilitator family transporter